MGSQELERRKVGEWGARNWREGKLANGSQELERRKVGEC
jgi:hypothetical protein